MIGPALPCAIDVGGSALLELITGNLPRLSLCFLLRDEHILLARKKRGFGKGKWNGVGGKVHAGESIEEAVVREAQEEIEVTPGSLDRVAVLRFLVPQTPGEDWLGEVHVYLSREWEGEPAETEEMAPRWFRRDEIPYGEMWADDVHWLPRILKGERLFGEFLFESGESIAEFSLAPLESERSMSLNSSSPTL